MKVIILMIAWVVFLDWLYYMHPGLAAIFFVVSLLFAINDSFN